MTHTVKHEEFQNLKGLNSVMLAATILEVCLQEKANSISEIVTLSLKAIKGPNNFTTEEIVSAIWRVLTSKEFERLEKNNIELSSLVALNNGDVRSFEIYEDDLCIYSEVLKGEIDAMKFFNTYEGKVHPINRFILKVLEFANTEAKYKLVLY